MAAALPHCRVLLLLPNRSAQTGIALATTEWRWPDRQKLLLLQNAAAQGITPFWGFGIPLFKP